MSEKSWHDELRNMKSKLDARDNMIERLIEAGEAMEAENAKLRKTLVELNVAVLNLLLGKKPKETNDNTDFRRVH